jgi:hypothetical protein
MAKRTARRRRATSTAATKRRKDRERRELSQRAITRKPEGELHEPGDFARRLMGGS